MATHNDMLQQVALKLYESDPKLANAILNLANVNWDNILIDVANRSKLKAVWLRKRLVSEESLTDAKTHVESLIK